MSYLIYCTERSRDGIACWWRADSRGYTTDVNTAGRYAKDDADTIARGSHGADFSVPEEAIGDILKPRLIVDMGDSENWKRINGYRPAPSERGAE